MLFSHSSFVPCLSFLTNFVDPCELISSKHEYSRLSIFLLFDYIVVIYRYGRTILRLIRRWTFSFSRSTVIFSLVFFSFIIIIIFSHSLRIHASETVLTLISSVTTSLTYILVRNQFVTFRFLSDFHDNGSCETFNRSRFSCGCLKFHS